MAIAIRDNHIAICNSVKKDGFCRVNAFWGHPQFKTNLHILQTQVALCETKTCRKRSTKMSLPSGPRNSETATSVRQPLRICFSRPPAWRQRQDVENEIEDLEGEGRASGISLLSFEEQLLALRKGVP
jgi:hypothetical protein